MSWLRSLKARILLPALGVALAGTLVTAGEAAAGPSWFYQRFAVGWGDNTFGAIGDGTTTLKRLTPVTVGAGQVHLAKVATNGNHGLGIALNGTVWAWGDNRCGQLGSDTGFSQLLPIQVPGLAGIVDVAAGGNHSLALAGDGRVFTWGCNGQGQLGDGTPSRRSEPAQLSLPERVLDVEAGLDFSLARDAKGRVYAWGTNWQGQIGSSGGGGQIQPTPKQVPLYGFAIDIAAGSNHSLAVLGDRSIWAWGSNIHGQLGDGSVSGFEPPVLVKGSLICEEERPSVCLGESVAVAAGSHHSMALTYLGAVYAWGGNNEGQLGFTGPGVTTMRTVSGLGPMTQIAGGHEASYALQGSAKVFAWGSNHRGELGDGTQTGRSLPAQVPMNGTVTVHQIAAGALGDRGMAATTQSLVSDPLEKVQVVDPGPDGLPVGGSLVVALINNSEQVMALSSSDLPPGVTATFDPGPVLPGGSTFVTLTADSKAEVTDGPVPITVIGSAEVDGKVTTIAEAVIKVAITAR